MKEFQHLVVLTQYQSMTDRLHLLIAQSTLQTILNFGHQLTFVIVLAKMNVGSLITVQTGSKLAISYQKHGCS